MTGLDPTLSYYERDLRAALARLLATYADLVGTTGEWTGNETRGVNDVALLEERLMHLLASVDVALGYADALLNRASELNIPDALPRSERIDWITDKILGARGSRRPG